MVEDLSQFTHENTQQYVGEVFTVQFANAVLELKLEDVQVLMEKHINPRMKRDTFAWHLRGQGYAPQGTYVLQNEHFPGGLPLFIVPISQAPEGVLYEAVFN
ncbi:MAG TPA: hypothetical protein VF618_07625 [Thermoanaerobaculia bacterium]